MNKTKMEKVFKLLDMTVFKFACKTPEERDAMKRYLLGTLASL